MQQTLETLRDELARVKARESLKKARILELQNHLAACSDEKKAISGALEDFRQKLNQQEKELEKLQKKCKALTTKNQKFQNTENALREEYARLSSEHGELQIAADKYQAELKNLNELDPDNELADILEFLNGLSEDSRRILNECGFQSNSICALLLRCGNTQAIIALWKACRQALLGLPDAAITRMAQEIFSLYSRANPDGSLVQYNPDLEHFDPDEAVLWWVTPWRANWQLAAHAADNIAGVLLPGLRLAGKVELTPLIALK